MDEQEVNCCVCLEPFDEDEHSPRTLRCGHTLCTFCIEALLQRFIHDRNCPECRKPLKITNVNHLPVSYTVLRLSRALSDVNCRLVNEVLDDGDVCLEHGSPIISWCKECSKWLCRRCKCGKGCSYTMPLSEALLHLKRERVDKTNLMISLLYTKKGIYEEMKQSLEAEISELEEKLEDVVEKLQKTEDGIAKLEEDEAQVVEFNSVRRIERAIRRSKKHMSELEDFIEDDSRESTPEVPLPAPVDIKDLKKRLQITQSMYAVHTKVDGSMRWSKLTVHGKNLLVHSSEATPPPPNATLVKFDRVMAAVQQSNQQAFLDIEIDERFEGRLYILVIGNTPRGENFLRFCRGDCGPCYKGLELSATDFLGNMVQSGIFEYEHQCKALVDGIVDGGEYIRKVHPGLICGGYAEESDKLSYFVIATKYGDGLVDRCSFAKVTNGLAVLRNAYHEIKNSRKRASISECGILVPLS